MGAFSGLKDAKRGFQSNPLQEGKYIVRIDGCEFFDTEQNGEMWKNTLTILSVIDGEHKVGEVVNTFFRMKAGKKTFQQNLKAFVAGVLDVDDDDVGEEDATEILSEKNPLKGLVTIVTGRRRTSKDKKTDEGLPVTYVVYSWTPFLSDEEIVGVLKEEGMARFFPNGL